MLKMPEEVLESHKMLVEWVLNNPNVFPDKMEMTLVIMNSFNVGKKDFTIELVIKKRKNLALEKQEKQ